MMDDKLYEDLQHILISTKALWISVKNKTFFITGGTGFFGKWLLHSFIYINNELHLNNKLLVLTRDASKFLIENPCFLNVNSLKFINGDVKSFEFPEGAIDYIIHAATEANASLIIDQPFEMYNTIVDGTKRLLELAKLRCVKSFLYVSSGAVYGEQPSSIAYMSEYYLGAPNLFEKDVAYGEGKRVAEMLVFLSFVNNKIPTKIARCFAFIGPYLPLNAHYAAGNFINSALENRNIVIKGDGTPMRSYLYASDLAVWLWTILFKGECGYPYNVGSDKDLSVKDLALKIKEISNNNIEVEIQKEVIKDTIIKRYVPDISRAKDELKLGVTVDIKSAIKKTLEFYKI